MKGRGKELRFWGRVWLESIGITVAVSIGFLVLRGLGSAEFTGDMGAALPLILSMTAYFIVIVGAMVTMLMMLGLFRGYFSLLVSMNVTRSRAICGIWLNQAAAVLGMLCIAALIWLAVPGEFADAGLSLLPLFAGILFAMAAVSMLFGVVLIRWGKVGVIILAFICFGIGGAGGMVAAMTAATNTAVMQRIFVEDLAGGNYWLIAVIGIGLYLLAGIFTLAATRRSEVRV